MNTSITITRQQYSCSNKMVKAQSIKYVAQTTYKDKKLNSNSLYIQQ